MSSELIATVSSALLLGMTMLIPGGRVLVLPALFTLIMVLLYWVAKPKPRTKE
ncbi:MAG: hypothetical protein HY270_18090 [Deltaproteobacteria bacterium]|nr:hypothetical protein [Deltaproteobacteria bacterium]